MPHERVEANTGKSRQYCSDDEPKFDTIARRKCSNEHDRCGSIMGQGYVPSDFSNVAVQGHGASVKGDLQSESGLKRGFRIGSLIAVLDDQSA